MKTNLKKLRKAAGWSNADEFARSIGMPPKTYRNYEQGVRKMGLDVASEICNALECSINDLMPTVEYSLVKLPETAGLPDDETELLDLYRRMDESDKQSFITMARSLAFAGDVKKKDARGTASGDFDAVR